MKGPNAVYVHIIIIYIIAEEPFRVGTARVAGGEVVAVALASRKGFRLTCAARGFRI